MNNAKEKRMEHLSLSAPLKLAVACAMGALAWLVALPVATEFHATALAKVMLSLTIVGALYFSGLIIFPKISDRAFLSFVTVVAIVAVAGAAVALIATIPVLSKWIETPFN